jgi:hypothetical protein
MTPPLIRRYALVHADAPSANRTDLFALQYGNAANHAVLFFENRVDHSWFLRVLPPKNVGYRRPPWVCFAYQVPLSLALPVWRGLLER